MEGNIVCIYRSRQQIGKGIIYNFDLSLVLNGGVRSSLVGYVITNIITGHVMLRIAHDVNMSDEQQSIIINDVLKTAQGIEKDIFC